MELWKSIEGYEGFYEVSSYGRVKSLKRSMIGKKLNKRFNDKIISQALSKKNSYYHVLLHKLGTRKNMLVHRLVALAFIEKPFKDVEVNHKDGNKLNNNVNNLEWVTKSENNIHARRLNLVDQAIGERNGAAKTTTASVYSIRDMIAEGILPSVAGKLFGINKRTVRDMCNGSTWTHIDYRLQECKEILKKRNRKA